MFTYLKHHKAVLILVFLIFLYSVYFSYFTILRYQTLYSSYFDLGIMNQTVYNTYMAIKTGDWSRVLEMTNPFGWEQIKRMAIHNDLMLVLFAPFYFIHAGPETLLVIQSIVLGLGAIAVYLLTKHVLEYGANNNRFVRFSLLPLVFSAAYLLYSPMQRANIFDFHAVTLAVPILLFMYYFWVRKKYWASGLLLILSLLTKEQVALTTLFFGGFILFSPSKLTRQKGRSNLVFGLCVVFISLAWFLLSLSVIIPHFRGDVHFALKYYGDFGDSPLKIIMGIIKKPSAIATYIFREDTLRYFWFLLGPLGFLSLLSPLHLAVAIPELAVNLLSNSWNMRNIIFHYTAVIQPWIFIAAIYGARNYIAGKRRYPVLLVILIMVCTTLFSYFKGPLPYSREAEIHPFKYPQKEQKDIELWAQILKSERYRISSTGQLAPFLTNRRYFNNFSNDYIHSDYVIVRKNEIFDYPEKDQLIPIYQRLQKDDRFKIIYRSDNFEVYRKIIK